MLYGPRYIYLRYEVKYTIYYYGKKYKEITWEVTRANIV